MKNKWKSIGISGVLFGTILSRWVTSYYGKDGDRVFAVSIIIIILAGLTILACKTKKFFGVLILLPIFLPLIIGFIGMYLGNIYMMIDGIIMFFVLGVLMIRKVFPWLESRK